MEWVSNIVQVTVREIWKIFDEIAISNTPKMEFTSSWE
jgi:hypothetical protein